MHHLKLYAAQANLDHKRVATHFLRHGGFTAYAAFGRQGEQAAASQGKWTSEKKRYYHHITTAQAK